VDSTAHDGAGNPENFYINIADLSENGIAFSRTKLQDWFMNIDRWKSDAIRTIPKYKKSLDRQYSYFSEKQYDLPVTERQ
jgi:hypothetical protein